MMKTMIMIHNNMKLRHHEPINNHYYFNEASGTVMISIIR